MVGLDIAGIDLVPQDISKPLQTPAAPSSKVNAGPGLLMHLKPPGARSPWARPSWTTCLPRTKMAGRIPVVGVAARAGHPAW